jgi:hypothetical protein
MHLLEFGLSFGAAFAVNGQAVIALEFFHRRAERIHFGSLNLAGKIPQVIQAGDLAGGFVDGVKMADFYGDDFVSEGRLIAADGEDAFLGIEGDFLFELALAVGS